MYRVEKRREVWR